MTKQHSRPCTVAFRGGCAEDSVPTFVRRPVRNTFTFTQRAVEHVRPITVAETQVMLQELIQASIDAKWTSQASTVSSESARPTWEQKVNRKRLLIAKCITNYPSKSSAWIARHTKTCLATVQRTKNELSNHQDLVPYSYNNTRSETDLLGLRNHLATVPDSFETLTDLKRKFPAFSRKRIAKELKGLGLRYAMLPRNHKVPLARKWNSKKIVQTISHVAQVLANPASTMLYCDEMKFPLYQTSKKKWMLKDQPCPQFYNRRTPEDTVITAIALCSTRGFECVQLFTQEITGPDFANFLHYAIEMLPSGHQYSILLDNATWHLAQPVTSSKVKPFLHFNEPGLFQLNMIENAFSGCRADFRKRPLVESMEEEARQILNIFFDPQNRERFQGYYRNHLRNLLKYLERHAPKAALNSED